MASTNTSDSVYDVKHLKLNTKQTMKQKLHSNTIYKNRDNILTGKQFLLIIPLTKFFCEENNIKKLKSIIDGNSKLSLRLIDWFVTNYSKKNLVMYNLKKLKKKVDETDSGVESVDDGKEDEEEYFSDYFNVFSDYRGQLKALNKKNFDPFCRRSRIKFFYNENDYIITTVGQLNFFKWAIENCILDYIETNMKEIEDDMNNFTNIKKYAGEKTKKNSNILDGNGANKPEKKAKRKYIKKKKNSGKQTKKNTDINTQSSNKQNDKNEKQSNSNTEKTTKTTRRKRKELSISANKSFIVHNLKSIIKFD